MPTTVVTTENINQLFAQLGDDLITTKQSHPFMRVAIVVPNRPLARWVQMALAKRLNGSAILGVEVITLYGLANRLVQNQNSGPVSDEVQRLLLSTLETPDWLDGMQGAHRLLMATFRDLFDAGFEVSHMDAATELLQDQRWWDRGEALLHQYAQWRSLAEHYGLVSRTDIVRQAADDVRAGKPVDYSQLYWYGVYDLTGAMADLFQALCRAVDGHVYLPAYAKGTQFSDAPSTADEYLCWLHETTIQPVTSATRTSDHPPPTLDISAFNASGERAELEETARRISEWADATGPEPPWESIAVVTRDLSVYRGLVEPIFAQYGIPASVSRPKTPQNWGHIRGLRAIMDLAREGLRRDRLIAAINACPPMKQCYENNVGIVDATLRRYGVIGNGDWDPVIDGHELPPLNETVIQHLRNHIRETQAALASWPERGSIEQHVASWRALVHAVWGCDSDHSLAAEEQLSALPSEFSVTRDDFLTGLSSLISAPDPSDTQQPGVWIMDIMEARGMSFKTVFLLGINRRRWPRVIREDPLIPDAIRHLMRRTLGLDALPIKDRGHAEEAFLFKMACSSATQQLTVSFLRSDEDGKALVPSPFLDTLRRQHNVTECIAVPRRRLDRVRSKLEKGNIASLPINDLAYWSAIHYRANGATPLEALCLLPERKEFLSAGLAVIDIRDTLQGEPGQFEGILGKKLTRQQSHPLAPTTAETLMRCPWTFFVQKVLNLGGTHQPNELPQVDAAELGNVVHKVHELLVNWLRDHDVQHPATWDRARTMADEFVEASYTTPLQQLVMFPAVMDRVKTLLVQLQENYSELGGLTPITAERNLAASMPLSNNHTVQLKARVDRLDLSAKGTVAVDLKSGGSPPKTTKELTKKMIHGQRLQGAFYHWIHREDPLAWSGYEFVMNNGQRHRVGLNREEWQALAPVMLEVLESACDLMRNNVFIFRNGNHCNWCDYSTTCLRQSYPSKYRLEQLSEQSETGLSEAGAIARNYLKIANDGVES